MISPNAPTTNQLLYRGWVLCRVGHFIQKDSIDCKFCIALDNPQYLKIKLTGDRNKDSILTLFTRGLNA